MLHNRVDVELPDRKPAAAHHTPDDLEPVGHLAVRGQVAQQGGRQQVPVAPLLLVRVRVCKYLSACLCVFLFYSLIVMSVRVRMKVRV